MKKIYFALILGLLISSASIAQNVYSSSGMEMLFQFADANYDAEVNAGGDPNNVMRWAPVLNIQSFVNYDLSDNIGLFTGTFIRNVGFISDIPTGVYLNNPDDPNNRNLTDVRYKFRTYNIGIPIGLKLGTMNKSFIYGGYEFAYSFNYKEKRFVDGNKSKNTYWFGDANNRVEPFQHGFFVGIQFPYGANIKFMYHLNNFHVKDYTTSNGDKPYEGFNANVFYFSLSFNVLKNTDFYYYSPEDDYEKLSN